MRTWEDIASHARGRFRIAAEEPGSLEVVWRFGGRGGTPVTQAARVALVTQTGLDLIEVRAPVGPDDLMDTRAALDFNARCSAGALCRVGRAVQVRAALPLEHAGEPLFDHLLERVAFEAARARRQLGRAAPPDPRVLDHYA